MKSKRIGFDVKAVYFCCFQIPTFYLKMFVPDCPKKDNQGTQKTLSYDSF